MALPRQLTSEEVREEFIKHLIKIAKEWDTVKGKTSLEKIEGAIFSTLAVLDGESVEFPPFIVAPNPDKSDRGFHEEQGENWFPENLKAKVKYDISGSLHTTFGKLRGKR